MPFESGILFSGHKGINCCAFTEEKVVDKTSIASMYKRIFINHFVACCQPFEIYFHLETHLLRLATF